MKNILKRRYWITLYCLLIQTSLWAQGPWPEVTKEMKPWTRWWWLGSAVDKANIQRELTLFESAGFGGVEITPIYGAKGYEHRYISFLSPEWMDMLSFTVERANGLGMGVDMNLGTGWPFGGPQVDEEYAATKFFLDEILLRKGEVLGFPLTVSDAKQSYSKLQALRAFKANGEEIDLDNYLDAPRGTSWTAPEEVRVVALFTGRTRQKVKRAAPGGEGFTLDHLGARSVQHYLSRFQHAFQGRSVQIRSFFNDSYEVYGANWTDDFLTIFERKKGYRLQDHLLDFAGKSGNKDKESRIKSDYREVVSAVLQQNFLRPFTGFARKYGAMSRNQAHGSPGNLIDLYASTDIAECETFGSSLFGIPNLRRDSADVRNVDPDPMMFKFASSATHTSGKKYTSSETFTWLTEHFKTSLSQAKPEVEQLFLAGVNHVFYHGTTYSPADVPYPGWLFYASVNFTTNNSFWPHLSGLNNYVTRVQSILQTAGPDNELLVYWPIYDIWHDTDGAFKQLSVHHVDKWLHPTAFYKQSVYLQRAGYSFDFVTDAILSGTGVRDGQLVTSAHAAPYRALYVPACRYFSEKTLSHLLQLVEEGATVFWEAIPEDVPGMVDVSGRRELLRNLFEKAGFESDDNNQYVRYGKGKMYLTADILSALETEQILAERLVRAGLKFTRRKAGDATYYYLVNHTAEIIDEKVWLNASGHTYTLLDPQTGQTFGLQSDSGSVRIQIPAGYAWIIKVARGQQSALPYRYVDSLQEGQMLAGPWRVSFPAGGPRLPRSRLLDKPDFWTAWNDPVADIFSGTGIYETTVRIAKDDTKAYLLQLGAVAESACVYVNGQRAGIVWANPFQLEIGGWLKDGDNEIRIEVANLMANRIRDLDRRKVPWRNYHEINFVNIDYKDFDASGWAIMDSGLKGPVRLLSY